MLPLALIAALLGAVLGLRFKVLVLVPAVAICLTLIMGGGIAFGFDPWQSLIAVVVATVALQIGFLVGSGLRLFIARARL